MRMAFDLDMQTGFEHLRCPTRTAQQSGRTHLAVHLQLLAVGPHHIDLHIGVRVDQVHGDQSARPLLVYVHLEQSKAVVRQGRRGRPCEQCGDQQRSEIGT